jgi:hypothetical protein
VLRAEVERGLMLFKNVKEVCVAGCREELRKRERERERERDTQRP